MNSRINTDQINEVYIPEIIRSINDLINAMIARHCKVFIVRIDVRFPVGFTHDGTNVLISEWIRRVVGYYGYHKIGCAQLWVREQKTSECPHYHVLLLLNGSQIQNGWGVREPAALHKSVSFVSTDSNQIWRKFKGSGQSPDLP